MKIQYSLFFLVMVVSSAFGEEKVLASNEAYSGFGDFSSGWQSFTVKENITVTRIDLFVKAVGIGESFSVNVCEYEPWEGSLGTPSESKTIQKEAFNSEPAGTWVSATWESPITLSAGKIYRINYESERETSGYNEYAYQNSSVFEAGRMNGGNGIPYGFDLTFRLWGEGPTTAIGPYQEPKPNLFNLRFVRFSFGDPYFYFDFETDERFAYILYYSDDLNTWRTFPESYNNQGTGGTITQHAGTLRNPSRFIRIEVVNLADTRLRKL